MRLDTVKLWPPNKWLNCTVAISDRIDTNSFPRVETFSRVPHFPTRTDHLQRFVEINFGLYSRTVDSDMSRFLGVVAAVLEALAVIWGTLGTGHTLKAGDGEVAGLLSRARLVRKVCATVLHRAEKLSNVIAASLYWLQVMLRRAGVNLLYSSRLYISNGISASLAWWVNVVKKSWYICFCPICRSRNLSSASCTRLGL